VQLGQGGASGLEALAIGVADAGHQVPVVAGRSRQGQGPARRDDAQSPLRIEGIGEPEQIALVGAAAVVEHEQAPGVSVGRPFQVNERRQA
jgi:hypothetical protein